MPKTKTIKHTKYDPQDFATHYIANKRNGQRAILAINPDITPASARVQASRMLSDANVQALLADWQTKLKSHVIEAIEVVAGIMQTGAKDKDRLTAARDIMDRAGLKPIERKASYKLNIDSVLLDEDEAAGDGN